MHSVWFLSSPWWTVLTELIMPGVAIFLSGYLAVRLQKREFDRQEAIRKADAAVRERERNLQAMADIINQSAEDNKKLITYASQELSLESSDLFRSLAFTELGMLTTDVPGSMLITLWLTRKRNVGLDMASALGAGSSTAYLLEGYFTYVQVVLTQWRVGIVPLEWFRYDLARPRKPLPTFEDEERFFSKSQKQLFRVPREGASK